MKKRIKGRTYLFLYIGLILLVLTSPFWLWFLKDSKVLEVLIIDKTVPDKQYREHDGVAWLLNHEKYTKQNGKTYVTEDDYVGFKLTGKQSYKIDQLPDKLNQYDLIYLTDLYGVYKEEFNKTNQLGARSEQIYGGLTTREVDKLEQTLLTGGKTLIAEFNTFASPTENEAKERISNILNVTWSGWIGRYFSDLNSDEVPVWVKENYQKFNGTWGFSGDGIVFVSQNDYIFVLSGEDLKPKTRVPNLRYTKQGKQFFKMDDVSPYSYWFDVVEARNQDEVLATYQVPVTVSGKDKLAEFGIPQQFPAIFQHINRQYTSYYFAGDFADEPEVPKIYQSKYISFWKKYLSRNPSFYWDAYVPMMKKILANGLHQKRTSNDLVELTKEEGVTLNSQTTAKTIQILKNGKWEDVLIKGVNMGIAKPGYFPGEAAITKAEYLRWFKEIGAMNANTIRVYTLHPPEFYEAFYEYNQIAEKPLYLLHGAWVNEEKLVSSQNAFSDETTDDFKQELKKVVDVIHGNAVIPEVPGHASGTYSKDISKYVLGYIIGIEWDPEAVLHTNENNPMQTSYNGTYFKTNNAAPFESWLAQMLDYTTIYEANEYKWQHTVSFTNWVTTDLLEHPAEPLANEDLVSVNPNHITKTAQFKAGLFASYHIYPYYPDSLNLEEKYIQYKDVEGKNNNYAGYLNELISAHHLPVLVAEFGVPSSRGLTHRNVHGMDQGNLSETEQGKINKRLFQSIVSEGFAGGIVFSWQDEWFKRTWNTMDYDDPNRRPYWANLQTNEQRFGLISFDPGKQGQNMTVDGEIGDWLTNVVKPLYENDKSLIQKVYVHSDEQAVYFRLDYQDKINWKKESVHLLLDTIGNQGQTKLSLKDGAELQTNFGVDFIVNLGGEGKSNVLVDSYYDPFYYQYGYKLHMIPELEQVNQKDNGHFNPIRLALNKKLDLPEQGINVKFQDYETGQLLFGDGNPGSKDFQSLTDVAVNNNGNILEFRIPWQLLNVKDPSQRLVMSDLWKNGIEGTEKTDGIHLALAIVKDKGNLETYPMMTSDHILAENATALYQWKEWEQPSFHERLKPSYYMMKQAFLIINRDK